LLLFSISKKIDLTIDKKKVLLAASISCVYRFLSACFFTPRTPRQRTAKQQTKTRPISSKIIGPVVRMRHKRM
jgi:hypothetical protein